MATDVNLRTGESFEPFVRNSLVRDMTFSLELFDRVRGVDLVDADEPRLLLADFSIHSQIGADSGWGKWEFFVFLATTMFVNSICRRSSCRTRRSSAS